MPQDFEQQASEIKKVSAKAMNILEALGRERNKIVREYIEELEQQKITAVRASLGLAE